MFFVEFKRKNKDLRPSQKLAKAALETRGFKVYHVDRVNRGEALFDEI
jgi:hypothetical protein